MRFRMLHVSGCGLCNNGVINSYKASREGDTSLGVLDARPGHLLQKFMFSLSKFHGSKSKKELRLQFDFFFP